MNHQFFIRFLIPVFVLISMRSHADEWPTYMNNAQRSGVSAEHLKTPLHLQWAYAAKHLPRPAWPSPALTDYWHREANLKPRVIFDRTNHVVTNKGLLYFASSADDKVYCLDAKTGIEKWSFFTGGPVRIAPALYRDRVYFGSDDGHVYCLDARSGATKWIINPAASERLLPGNERIISACPVRTGVLIYDDIAYFASGIFPTEGVSLYAVNALTGETIWKKPELQLSPQGYLLAIDENLYVPTGRTQPVVFDRKTGEKKGQFEGNGGAYALVVNDTLVFGGGDQGKLDMGPSCDNTVASFGGLQMIVSGGVSYLRSDDEISAISRRKYLNNFSDWEKIDEKRSDWVDILWDLREKRTVLKSRNDPDTSDVDRKIEDVLGKIEKLDIKQNTIESSGTLWKTPVKDTYSMIMAGKALVIGRHNEIQVLNSENGEPIWSSRVEGNVYGLAESGGNLFASTDKGKIYCFGQSKASNPPTIKSTITDNPYHGFSRQKDYEILAREIIEKTGLKTGYCLVVDAGDGQLAYELAKNTGWKIIGVEDDPSKVLKARKLLDQAGIYGAKVSIHQSGLAHLPYTRYFANLVVWGSPFKNGTPTTPPEEILRMVQPFGGKAIIGSNRTDASKLKAWADKLGKTSWKVIHDKGIFAFFTKGSEPGFGEWTHQYANPGNTASSMDQVHGPMQIQWFGKPGPRKMINRHSRSVSPLVKDGRLFVPADNRIIAVDAYNGIKLWETMVPDSRLLGALKDFGNRVLTHDMIYVAAKNECIGFDVEKGNEIVRLEVPQLIKGQIRDWGYVASVGDQIYGTAKKPGAQYTILGRFNCDDFEGDFRDMVTGDYLFGMSRYSGRVLWTYKNGVVFNNTVTIGGDYIYFVESRNSLAISDMEGRMRVDHFCKKDNYIVKLNRVTGEKMWEKPYKFPFQQIMYLSFADNVLLVTGSYNVKRNVHYGLFAFDGDTGRERWQNSYKGGEIGGSHGEQWQHPVIIKDRIYIFPYDFDLHTGVQGGIVLSKGGCGGFSGSANNLFARKSNPTMFDLAPGTQEGTGLTKVNRPGCWINIIPAGGIISIPESSSGCTCDYPIQTSFAFIPRK